MTARSPSVEVMKQSAPYFSSMTLRKPAGILRRPLSSTFAGACPIRTAGSTMSSGCFYHYYPLLSTKIHGMKRLAILALLMTACATTHPPRAREMRGVWVATVNNLDWPSRRDLAAEEQQRELTAIFDRAVELHLNAIFLQVRPMADAIYPSPLEPWSEFLGPAATSYDPLAFAVREAHARGLELHAWFNPFRGHETAANAYPYGKYVW